MRIHIASDHAGYELKSAVSAHLREQGHTVIDHGAHSYDPDDDYPAFCLDCGEAVVADAGSLGIVLGGSGNGEQIAANKVDGVRAALAWSIETARLARQHNNANVVALGGRMHDLGAGPCVAVPCPSASRLPPFSPVRADPPPPLRACSPRSPTRRRGAPMAWGAVNSRSPSKVHAPYRPRWIRSQVTEASSRDMSARWPKGRNRCLPWAWLPRRT